jgi:hypothetical protein
MNIYDWKKINERFDRLEAFIVAHASATGYTFNAKEGKFEKTETK